MPTPKHERLAQRLAREIRGGRWKPHDQLPTENELVARHRLSGDTVRKALSSLEQQGYLYRKPRLGSFVSPRRNRGTILVVFRGDLDPADGGTLSPWAYPELDFFLALSFLRQKGGCDFDVHLTHEKSFLGQSADALRLGHPQLSGVLFFRTIDGAVHAKPELDRLGIPFFFYGSSANEARLHGIDCCLYDEAEITRIALDALYEKGHRNIAILYGPGEPLQTRLRHYQAWMTAHGLPCPDSALLELAGPSAREALLWRLTRERRGLTALFSTGDEFILETLSALPGEGISVPRDLSIVSVNRAPAGGLIRPRLTSVYIPIAADAPRCLEALVARIDGSRARAALRSAVTLFPGETIAAPEAQSIPSTIPPAEAAP